MSDPYRGQASPGDWPQSGPPAVPGTEQGQPPAPRYQQGYPPPQQQQQYPPPAPQAGYGPPGGYGYPAPFVVQQAPSNGVGVAGFVCGLLGLLLFWVPVLGLVLGLLGLILGGVGISAGRRSGAGIGLAVAGLVLGIISLVPAIIVISALSNA